MTKGKNKKMKITKIYLFLLPPVPSQDGEIVTTPLSPTFCSVKILNFFFIDTWVSGQRVGKLAEWKS